MATKGTQMKSIHVKITDEALQKHASCDVFDALGQVIFNAIDSSAKKVEIFFEYEEKGLDSEGFSTKEISCIRVKDDGCGIPFNSVNVFFSQYNKSWKKDKARPDGRPYQGKLGIGRFKYFSLGHSIQWNTCYKKESEGLYDYLISCSFSNPKIFPVQAEKPSGNISTGTEVIIKEISSGVTQKITADNFSFYIAELVGLYIKSNPHFQLFIDGNLLNPDDFIDEERTGNFVVTLEDIDYIFKYNFIVWKADYVFKTHKHTFLFDESKNYKGIFASGVNAADTLPFHTVFLISNFFEDYDDFSTRFKNVDGTIKRAYRELLLQFLYDMRKKRSKERFKIFSKASYYPFSSSPKDEIEAAERNLFDLCAFSILEHENKVLDSKNSSLILLFKLLRRFIEKDSDVAANLSEILSLSSEDSEKLRVICESTPLPALIKHYNEIVRREAFLDVLDTLVHEDFYKAHLRERTQLHKIIERETWIFGDKFDYNLKTSDQGMINVLRKTLPQQELSDDEINEIIKNLETNANDAKSYLKKIPDLYMSKSFFTTQSKQTLNLVVELKAPLVPIGPSMHKQAMDIYNAISRASGVDISSQNKWEYWLVSADISDDMKNYYQGNSSDQLLYDFQQGNYRIYCRTWRQIIGDGRAKLSEQRRGLEVKIKAEQKRNLLDSYLKYISFEPPK